jgi:hypothetical protein
MLYIRHDNVFYYWSGGNIYEIKLRDGKLVPDMESGKPSPKPTQFFNEKEAIGMIHAESTESAETPELKSPSRVRASRTGADGGER